MQELTEQKCEACRVGAPSVTPEEIRELQPKIPDWQIIEEDGIRKLDRRFQFKNFKDALAFTNAVGAIAEEEGHHPRLTTEWGPTRSGIFIKTISSWRLRPTRFIKTTRRVSRRRSEVHSSP